MNGTEPAPNLNSEAVAEVVVILPYVNDRVLMQLRDDKSGIAFPNQWGFFGGSIEDGETPLQAGERELFEEIGHQAEQLAPLGAEYVRETGFISHAFCFPLPTPLSELSLFEGQDMALVALAEVLSGEIKSPGLGLSFKVPPVPYIPNTFQCMLSSIN